MPELDSTSSAASLDAPVAEADSPGRQFGTELHEFFLGAEPAGATERESREQLELRLEEALQHERYGKICHGGPNPQFAQHRRLTQSAQAARGYLALALGFAAAYQIGLPGWSWALAAVACYALLMVVVFFVTRRASDALAGGVALAILLAWFASGTVEIVSSRWQTAAATHVLPAGIVGGAVMAIRGLRFRSLLGSMPWAFPITMLVLFIPLFTQELWRIAADLDEYDIVGLALLTSLPLFVVMQRQLKRRVVKVFADSAHTLSGHPADSREKAQEELTRLSLDAPVLRGIWLNAKHWASKGWIAVLSFVMRQPIEPRPPRPPETYTDRVLEAAFIRPAPIAYTRRVANELKDGFRRPIYGGLISVILGIGAMLSLYIYVLAAVAIDRNLVGSEDWTNRDIETWSVPVLGLDAPLGPYLLVAAFLGVVATAVFLAFALIEDRMSDAIADTIVHQPVQRCLLLAIPYIHLRTAGEHADREANDNFEAALRLVGDSDELNGDNEYKTHEPDEPRHADVLGGASAWYRWTPSKDGSAKFEVEGKGFEPLLAVYRGTNLLRLEPVADDSGASNSRCRVVFGAKAGVEYKIAVDGLGGKGGPFTVRWMLGRPPANTTFDMPIELTGERGVTPWQDNMFAVREPGEPLHGGAGGGSLWYRWKAPITGTVTFVATGGFDTLVAVYRGDSLADAHAVAVAEAGGEAELPVPEGEELRIAVDGLDGARGPFRLEWRTRDAPSNTLFEHAEELSGASGSVEATNEGGSKQRDELSHAGDPGGSSIWFRWTAPDAGIACIDTLGSDFDTLLAVYSGSSIGELASTLVAASDDAVGRQSRVAFPVEGGEELRIAVDGYNRATGGIRLNWAILAPPPNAEFADATRIEGPRGSVHGHNFEAGREPGEPAHAGAEGGNSVWFAWRAPATALMRMDTLGSDFDTLLAVYRGDDVQSLQLVEANDDVLTGTQSRVVFEASSGEELKIAVDGYRGAAGQIELNWDLLSPPGNASPETAAILSGESGTEHGHNFGAGRETGEPDHAGERGGNSIWYRWLAPNDGELAIDTIGSELPALLAVYAGTELEKVVELESSSDPLGRAEVSVPVRRGNAYTIAVDGSAGAMGSVTLNWKLHTRPVNDRFENAVEIEGETGIVTASNRVASKEPDEPDHAGSEGGHSVWYRWTAPAAGKVTFSTVGSSFDTLLAVYRGNDLKTLDLVTENDDAIGTQSRAHTHVEQGEQYRIAVDGYDGETGEIVLSWELLPSDGRD